MPWGFAAVAAGTIASAAISSSASSSAASTQADAANNATAAQLSMFNTTQNNLAPYMNAGGNALNILSYDLGLGTPGATGIPGAGNPLATVNYGSTANGLTMPTYSLPNFNYQQSPGYQWQLSQGLGAINNAASASGGIGGGNTLKALTTYATGVADQDYQQQYQNFVNAYNNQYNSQATNYLNAVNSVNANSDTNFNRLWSIIGSGQNAAANLGSLGSQAAGQVGSNLISAGNARAAGQVGAANAITGGVNNLSQLAFLYQQNPGLFSSGSSGSLTASQLNPGGFGG